MIAPGSYANRELKPASQERPDNEQQAYSALEGLIREAQTGRITGTGAIRLRFKQGGISKVEVDSTKEVTQ